MDCRVHAGFKKIQNEMFSMIQPDWMYRYINSTKEVCITGHSLGGALATIHAFRLRYFIQNRIVLTTFGSPRVGNDGFSRHMLNIIDKSYRYVNGYDIIPHVPPSNYLYMHIQREYWYINNTIHLCSEVFEDSLCSYSVHPRDYNIKDHFYYFDSKMVLDETYKSCMESFNLEQHINEMEDNF
jgi:hypothetical protein